MNKKRQRRKKRLFKRSQFKVRDCSEELVLTRSSSKTSSFSHPNCYAKGYGECDKTISKEHFVSQAILENFETILPENVEYLKGYIKTPIKPTALSVKCLCEYHNHMLSSLDGMIGIFFEEIMRFHEEKNRGVVFNGKNIERWFAKCLIGYVATNKLHHNGKYYTLEDIDPSIVKFLFEGSPLDDEIGLYFVGRLGQQNHFSKRFMLQALFLEDRFSGITILFGGFQFYFSLEKREKAFREIDPRAIVLFRPKLLKRKKSRDFLKISW